MDAVSRKAKGVDTITNCQWQKLQSHLGVRRFTRTYSFPGMDRARSESVRYSATSVVGTAVRYSSSGRQSDRALGRSDRNFLLLIRPGAGRPSNMRVRFNAVRPLDPRKFPRLPMRTLADPPRSVSFFWPEACEFPFEELPLRTRPFYGEPPAVLKRFLPDFEHRN